MQINRFNIDFNYKKIEDDFFVSKITNVKFKQYAQFYNQIKDELKEEALSIVYVNSTVYILSKKKLDPNKTEFLIKKQNIRDLGKNQDYIIFKLLVYAKNSINDEKVVFDSNGIYYIVKTSKRVYETVLINIQRDSDDKIIFKLNAKNFIKKIVKKATLEKRDKYIDKDVSLVRVKNSDILKYYFVKQKEFDGYNRSSVDFLQTDWTKKSNTKLYALIRFLKDINKNLKKYLSVELDELEFQNFELKVSGDKRRKVIDDLIIEKLSKEKDGLVIEDFVKNERSINFIDEVKKIIKDKYNSKVTLGSIKKSKSIFNIFITIDKGFENDPYKEIKVLNKSTQNIKLVNLENTKTILPVLLKELVVKQDILNQKISIPNYQKSNKMIFYYFEKDKEKKDKYFIYKLLIDNENIELNEVKYNQSLFEEDEKSYIQRMLFLANQNNSEPELIIEDENGNVNFIIKTNYFPIPNIEHVTKEYSQLEKPYYKAYNDLVKFSNDVPNDRKDEYIEFLESIKNKDKINLKTEVKNKKVKNYLASKFNVNLDKNLNRSRKNNTVLDVLTGIKFFKIDEKNAYYVVGTKEIASSFSRTNTIRKIEAINGALLLDNLLPMMDEYFVKNKELTVLPYPLKYLREFSEVKKYK